MSFGVLPMNCISVVNTDDETRVKLSGGDADYINASYIHVRYMCVTYLVQCVYHTLDDGKNNVTLSSID